MNLDALKKEIPYKWKPQWQNKAKDKWQCVAYIDARDVQDILDSVCWTHWQSEFYEVKGKLFCKIWIKIENEWVWRSDTWFLENEHIDDGTESKWEASDTFKRAAVQWGIGRFLYSKKIQWITNDEYNKNKFNLTQYIESRLWNTTPINQDNEPNPHTNKKDIFTLKTFKELAKELNEWWIDVGKAWIEDNKAHYLFPDFIKKKISTMFDEYQDNMGIDDERVTEIFKEFTK